MSPSAESEPTSTPARRWTVVTLDDVVQRLRQTAGERPGPRVVGVDGHSSSGKTTVSARIADRLGAALVHTDDLAWFHAAFDWEDLLVDGVLTPYRAGEPVAFRPPAWDRRGREGAVRVPAHTEWLVVEGVACTRPTLRGHFDATVWMETAADVRHARDEVRVAAGEISPASHLSWMAEEALVVAAARPWTGADVVLCGDGTLATTADEVVVALTD